MTFDSSVSEILSVLSENGLRSGEDVLICSAGGRVLYGALHVRGERCDLRGRHLNDIIGDDHCADLICAARAGEPLSLECYLFDTLYALTMEPYQTELIISAAPASGCMSSGVMPDTAELLAREIRIPLANMSLALGLVLQTANDETSYACGVLRRSVLQLQRFAANLSDLVRLENRAYAADYQRSDLVALVRELCAGADPFFQAKGVSLEPLLPPGALMMSFDRAKVERLLLNLLSNALKYTGSGGRVTVELLDREETAVLSVADTGCGVPARLMPYMFQRYRVSPLEVPPQQHDGAGLGLALVRAIAALHGGSAVAESQEGRGTTLSVSLRKRSVPGEMASASQPLPDYTGSTDHLLFEFSSAAEDCFFEGTRKER